MHIGWQSAILV